MPRESLTDDELQVVRDAGEKARPWVGPLVLRLLDEHAALRDELTRYQLAIEEAPHTRESVHAVAYFPSMRFGGEGKTYAIAPDKVSGLLEFIRSKVRQLGDWSAYKQWHELSGRVPLLEGQLAQARADAVQMWRQRGFADGKPPAPLYWHERVALNDRLKEYASEQEKSEQKDKQG